MRRIQVMGECAPRCPSCAVCRPDGSAASEAQVLAQLVDVRGDVLLGGGDATRWPPLASLLEKLRDRAELQAWVEAPAASFTAAVVRDLASRGVRGVVVLIEALGEPMRRALRVGDGEEAIRLAEEAGLATQARLLLRPKTFVIAAPLARKLAPRPVWLEIVRRDWGKQEVPMPIDTIGRLLEAERNLSFSVHRVSETGYLPPCALPEVWQSRPEAFRAAIGPEEQPNATFEACAGCALSRRCAFRDRDAIEVERRASLRPVRDATLPWDRRRTANDPVPAAIVRRRDHRDVVCTTPWTTMEVVDPDGRVRQCCSTWTVGDRGNVFDRPLLEIWNGEGYRTARRVIANGPVEQLCLPICSRLHDRKYEEKAFTIQRGSPRFVENQLLIAEEIAERAEVVRSKPLRLALCPSTYCNYNCIMCDHGRSPRRELPEHVWDELTELLPTLQTLTFLGGEPLAQQRVVKFLGELDAAETPDLAVDFVTNGSLLSPKVIARLSRAPLGDVTISLNAGSPDAYERVQRGAPLAQVHQHIDALLELRRAHPRWFGVTVSFVVQPASSATLIAFAEFAHQRNLRIRLMALNPEQFVELDYYQDADTVARVVRDVDALIAWSERVRPEWLPEIRAARKAVLGEAAARARGAPASVNQRRLPVTS